MAIQLKIEDEDDSNRNRRGMFGRRMIARKHKVRNLKRRRRIRNDSDEEEEEEDNTKKEFDPGYYYESTYCLKSNITFLINTLKTI